MKRQRGLIIDLFAGGGGASTGLAAALGRDPDVALNHDELAMAVYRANHSGTLCLPEDVWKTPPRKVLQLLRRLGRRLKVWILWASPDCTHFSKAKGSKPRSKGVRALAHVIVRWARDVSPEIIFMENVEEFRTWGPLYEVGHVMPDGRVLADGDPEVGMPIPERAGEDFERWRGMLELLGYRLEWRVLDASEHGAPTRRRRLFIVARRDGQPIYWPAPTHGPGLLPFNTAASCIDWTIPCPSIFAREKPLAEKTLWRVAQGIRKYVLDNPKPFIVKVNHGGRADRAESINQPLTTVTAARRGHALVAPSIIRTDMHKSNAGCHYPVQDPLRTITTANGHAVVAPTLVQTGYGERPGQRPRYLNLHEPLGTVVAGGPKHALVAAFLAKHYGGHTTPGTHLARPMDTITTRDHHGLAAVTLAKLRGDCNGADIGEPVPTITSQGTHIAEVRAFLTAYYGEGSEGQKLSEPMRTLTTKHRLGLVTVEGVEHQIVDIGLRMLEPHELLRAQFGKYAEGYDLNSATSKAAKVRLIGNSVCPELAEAVVRANVGGNVATERRAA